MVTCILNIKPLKARNWVIFLLFILQRSATRRHLIVFCTPHSLTLDDSPVLIKTLGSEPQCLHL